MGNSSAKKQQKKKNQQQSLLNESENNPINVQRHIVISVDPQTGQLIGVPEEWMKYNLDLDFDRKSTVITRGFPQVANTQEISSEILQLLQEKQEQLTISTITTQTQSRIIIQEQEQYEGQEQQQCQGQQQENLKTSNVLDAFEEIKQQEHPVEQQNKQKISLQRQLTQNELLDLYDQVHIRQEDPSNKYEFLNLIGKGSYCKVYECIEIDTNTKRAIRTQKIIKPQQIQGFKQEISQMIQCSNPQVVQYHEAFLYLDVSFMVLDFMPGGNLAQFIFNNYQFFTESMVSYMCSQILSGLEHIHSHNQIHRDLKSDNILLDESGNVKISDFGFATTLTTDNWNSKSLVGTLAWMAPEIILKQNHTQKIDIWSLGIICVEMLEKEPPYIHEKPSKAMYYITKRKPYQLDPKKYSANICSFVEACLQQDPERRSSAKELLNHPFIMNYNSLEEKSKTQQTIAGLVNSKVQRDSLR